ncbi:MAG: T9SS type A sorting domain-containing protein [Saprospiraceae bacterium]|nr:T9SS type A sorting domain-containing protein [Saprospiraceae bacterium]
MNTISTFPNPAANMTTVQYEVKEAGRIRIDVQDERGNVVKTLVDEIRTPGTYTLEVNVSNFRNSTYYFVLTDSKGKVTQKTVISQQ